MAIFRKLLAEEIECRVATVKQPNKEGKGGGTSILLYKDARVDMKLLDEVFTPMGWKREHKTIDGRLYCTISVYDKETQQWISKEDVGVESYTEKEKGQASDSFKRAGFNWGIGRELYTAPFIWINLTEKEWRMAGNGFQPKINLHVAAISYSGDCISKLILEDSNGVKRYEYGKTGKVMHDVNEAIEAVKKCKNRDELKAVWDAYKDLHNNTDLIDTVTLKGEELKADNN